MAVILLCVLALPGCPPTETPGYSPDGNTIALVASHPSTTRNVIWLYDVQSQTARAHHAPGDWNVMNVQWIGSQLWVECARTVTMSQQRMREKFHSDAAIREATAAGITTEDELILSPFDPERDGFIAGAPRITRRPLVFSTHIRFAVAAHAGKPALFVESDDADHHEIYDLTTGRMIRADGRLQLLSAGRGWSVRPTFESDRFPAALREVLVQDAAGAQACAIQADEIAPACHRDARIPRAARVSTDGEVVALAFDTETIFRNHPRKYTFGIFHVPTGELLWAGGSDSMNGVPLVQRDQLWTIEFVGRNVYLGEKGFNLGGGGPADPVANRFSLVKHRAGKTPSHSDGQREVIFEYNVGEGASVKGFAPAPDGSHFLVAVSGRKPRLLFVPITQDARETDVTVMELK